MMRRRILFMIAASTICHPVMAQRIMRIDVTPVIGATVFVTQLPDRFRLDGPHHKTLEGIGLNDAPVIGGHLNIWLSPSFALEGSGLFMPTRIHGDGTISVDVSVFTLGGRFASATGKARPFFGVGLGTIRYDFTGGETGSVSHFATAVSAGAFMELAPEIRLRVEARDCISVFASKTDAASRTQHDVALTIGIDLAVMRRGVVAALH